MPFILSFFSKLSIITIFFIGSAISLHADTLTMMDGSVLMGKVVSQEKNTLKFKTSYAGTINIKWDQVKHFQTDEAVKIMLTTGELITTTDVNIKKEGLTQIKKQNNNELTDFRTKNVAYINPDPWRLNQGYKISGIANFSLKAQHGNTKKDEIEMDGKLIFRSLQDRYSFVGELENDNSSGTKTADNWLISGKYDYFVSKKRYYGIGLSFERDRFTDLNLRTTISPHIGRQFYESKDLNLKAEIGLAKVYEDNMDTDDHDYIAMNWHVDYDQYFFNELTQFYHEQRGIWDIEITDKVTFNSWTGFRFPLQFGLVASAEIELEYDSQPADLVHKTDTTYRVKIGYQW